MLFSMFIIYRPVHDILKFLIMGPDFVRIVHLMSYESVQKYVQ